MRPNLITRTALGIGALAVPTLMAVAGAGQAAANPDVCATGPWGYVTTCFDVPGYWDGPDWHDNGRHVGWYDGHGHGGHHH